MKIKLGAWKYQGRGVDFGRVIYQRSQKWWVRIGPYIAYVEAHGCKPAIRKKDAA